ncbi:MAG: hypothetical protein V3U09_04425 [Thermoplasmata archaeon]
MDFFSKECGEEVEYLCTEADFKLWFEVDGKPVIGDGTASLLPEIDDYGSLSQAAMNLEISYRQAYKQIQNLNKRCGKDVLESSIGGKKGGGTKVTQYGKKMIEDSFALREAIEHMTRRKI